MILEYKGYETDIKFSPENGVYIGYILGIDDIFVFQCDNEAEFMPNFKDAVDDYIETCKEINKEPQRPMLHA